MLVLRDMVQERSDATVSAQMSVATPMTQSAEMVPVRVTQKLPM